MGEETNEGQSPQPEPIESRGLLVLTRSRELGALIGAERQQCWRNAVMTLLAVGAQSGAQYVEGWAAVPFGPGFALPIEHGWVEMPDGAILDPTFTLDEDTAANNTRLAKIRYFAGARYSYAVTQERAGFQAQVLPLVYHDSEQFGGFGVVSYLAACRACAAACQDIAQA